MIIKIIIKNIIMTILVVLGTFIFACGVQKIAESYKTFDDKPNPSKQVVAARANCGQAVMLVGNTLQTTIGSFIIEDADYVLLREGCYIKVLEADQKLVCLVNNEGERCYVGKL